MIVIQEQGQNWPSLKMAEDFRLVMKKADNDYCDRRRWEPFIGDPRDMLPSMISENSLVN